jgi:hypothetical protein
MGLVSDSKGAQAGFAPGVPASTTKDALVTAGAPGDVTSSTT